MSPIIVFFNSLYCSGVIPCFSMRACHLLSWSIHSDRNPSRFDGENPDGLGFSGGCCGTLVSLSFALLAGFLKYGRFGGVS